MHLGDDDVYQIEGDVHNICHINQPSYNYYIVNNIYGRTQHLLSLLVTMKILLANMQFLQELGASSRVPDEKQI